MIEKMKLKTVIVVYNDLHHQQVNKEQLELFMNQIQEEYEGFWYMEDRTLEQFCSQKGIDYKQTLIIGDKRSILLHAKELGIAVLACEGSCQLELPLMDNSVQQEDHSGFELIALDVWEYSNLFLKRCFERERRLPWDILETKRLIIREECEEDIDNIYEMYTQEHIKKYLEPPYPEKEKELDYIRKYRKYVYGCYGYGLWHVIDKETGRSAGRAGLNPKTYEDECCGVELGYMIVEPFLRRGYCMEVCEAIIEYARDELEVEELFCMIRPDNEVSIHIAERLGFHKDCVLQENGQQMLRFRMETRCKS